MCGTLRCHFKTGKYFRPDCCVLYSQLFMHREDHFTLITVSSLFEAAKSMWIRSEAWMTRLWARLTSHPPPPGDHFCSDSPIAAGPDHAHHDHVHSAARNLIIHAARWFVNFQDTMRAISSVKEVPEKTWQSAAIAGTSICFNSRLLVCPWHSESAQSRISACRRDFLENH